MGKYWKVVLLFLGGIQFSIGFANEVKPNRWKDTLDKYVRTPPALSIIGLGQAISDGSLSDSLKADMMVALVNDYAQLRKKDSARSMAIRAYALARKVGDKRRVARSALSLAWTSRDFGRSNEVLEKSLEAESLSKALSDTNMLIMCYNTIASVYYDVKNDSLQKEYLEKSYAMANATGEYRKAMSTMSNLGYIYLKEGNYQGAEKLFMQVINTVESAPFRNYSELYLQYSHLVDLYEKQERFKKCLVYSDTLASIASVNKWDDYTAMQEALVMFFNKKANGGSYDKQKLEALNSVDLTGFTVDEKKIFLWNKTRINKEFGRYKEALEYQNTYYTLTDSLNQDDLRDQIAHYKEQFDASQREQKIQDLETENTIAKLKSEQQSKVLWLLVFGLVIMLVFVLFILNLNRKLKKTKLELEQLNQVKDKFFAIVSHDLRSSISAFQGVGEIINSYVKKEKWERLIRLGGRMDEEASKLNDFLNGLLNWSLAQVNRVPYHPQELSVKEKIDEVLQLLNHQIISKKIEIEVDVANEHNVFADNDALLLVVRNLLSNAVKFSNDSGKISISSKKEGESLVVTFKDAGVGMTEEKLNSLFSPAVKKSEKGTKGERGTGLGLVLVKEFLEINKGRIVANSSFGKGSTFSVVLPQS